MFNQFPNIKLLLQRLLLAILLASLCRLFFLLFNPFFFSFGFSMLLKVFAFGLLFDFSSLIYLNSLFILLHLLPLTFQNKKWYQQILMGLFFLTNGAAMLFNLIDTGYYPFSGKRSGMELFEMAKELEGGLQLAYLIDFWYLWVVLFALLYLMVYLYFYSYKKSLLSPAIPLKGNLIKYLSVWILSIGIAIVGARGGVGLLPLNTFDAARQTRPELVPLVVNTPFNIILSTQQSGIKPVTYFSKEVATQLFNPLQFIADTGNLNSARPNIVLIIVEGLGKENNGFFNKSGYTPFLDSLMHYSTVFTHAYSNGKKSIEGIPAILASMPSLFNTPYISSYYQGNHLNSAGSYLKELGYNASFYHGGRNGTMSFDNFIAISNGGEYFGLTEYDNDDDFDGNWGIYDEPYLNYFARELGKKPLPFFSTVFTLSSHHPYGLPAKFKNKFAQGTLPIHKTIAYVDYSLQQFFEAAKKQAWFNNTVFIITADHSSENQQPYYLSPQGKFMIPLVIYKAGQDTLRVDAKTVSQADILPMILREAGYPRPFYTFGNYFNLGDKEKKGYAIQYHDQYYQLIQWPYVYQFDGQKELGFYQLETDSMMNKNLIKSHKSDSQKMKMDSVLKSMIQRYNADLIDNETTVKR